jgi:hypothetical protein
MRAFAAFTDPVSNEFGLYEEPAPGGISSKTVERRKCEMKLAGWSRRSMTQQVHFAPLALSTIVPLDYFFKKILLAS